MKWSSNGQYYRCRILKETGTSAEIQFIDYGDILTVSRREIFVPVASSRLFTQPAFGINCILSPEGAAALKKEDWDSLLLEKSFEVKIDRKNPDGTYTVAFTNNSYNQQILGSLKIPFAMGNPSGKLVFIIFLSFNFTI